MLPVLPALCPEYLLRDAPDYEGESGMQPWIPVAPGEEP